MSIPLLVVVTSWLVDIFISFGIFAPSNSTVMIAVTVCAIAFSVVIPPFSGFIEDISGRST